MIVDTDTIGLFVLLAAIAAVWVSGRMGWLEWADNQCQTVPNCANVKARSDSGLEGGSA